MSAACEHDSVRRTRVRANVVEVRCNDCGHRWSDLISRPLPQEMVLDPNIFDGYIGYGVAE